MRTSLSRDRRRRQAPLLPLHPRPARTAPLAPLAPLGLLALLAAALLYSAALLAAPAPAGAAPAPKQWTVMLYLDGENREIQGDLLTAFADMIAADVGSNADVSVVVQFDRIPKSSAYGGWTEAHRFYVTPGMEPTPANAIADWGDGRGGREVEMSDGATLRSFVTWAADTYPAARYALIVADHGYGWKGLCIDETSLAPQTVLAGVLAPAVVDDGRLRTRRAWSRTAGRSLQPNP